MKSMKSENEINTERQNNVSKTKPKPQRWDTNLVWTTWVRQRRARKRETSERSSV